VIRCGLASDEDWAVEEIERRGTNIPASRIPAHHEGPSDGAASYAPRAAHD
jgi:hypothetical protein